ncbi:MAG TPA: DegT/DnrJ/EryC1/StrS family aminotransferase [Verrucomicrobiae bacterium]|nr:DegT/DnrJ/EryC1/StrS family aminotransferase [Verrucomicrobiae bacterium]
MPSAKDLALLGGKPIRIRPFTSWPIFGKEEEKRLLRALRSGKWGRLHGDEVVSFEKRFAEMHGCRHAIAVCNGTVSLRIALLAAGIEADDEVIIPPYTFVSTATAVIEANAIPVFADIDLETFNLDPAAIRAAITPRTRAIIPVHFAGQIADMRAIKQIARKHNLIIIEDAAHAHAARYENSPAGSLGHFGSFSFQSSKNVTSGEGGIITTDNDSFAEACRSVHSCGRVEGGVWYEHHRIAGNYRLTEFQGAVLNAQLNRLEKQTEARDLNGQRLAGRLAKIPGLHPQRRLPEITRHSYHLFMMRIDPKQFGAPRSAVLKALQAEGIPCSAGYGYSLPQQPLFKNKTFGPYLPKSRAKLNFAKAKVPISDLLCREQCIWLEQSMFLGRASDIDNIADAFEKVHANRDQLVRAAIK